MSGRPRTSIGTFGEIRIVDLGGKYRAETRYRDLDGRLRKVRATARSLRAVRSSIKDRLASRVGYGGGGLLSLSSPFGDLAELWLDDLEVRDISEGTKENYRDDLRLHVLPFFASYMLGELSTGRAEVFLKQELAVSYSRAKHSKTLLSMLFAFALRHDAIPRNPLEGTSDLIRPKHVVQAMTLAQVQQIRAAAAAWRTGPDIKGPRPDGTVRDVCEVLLGTSMRPGEVLALRPVDITETRQGMVVHIQGTVVERKKTGCHRQDHPKTDASNRRIPVPEFAAQVIRERLAQMTPDQAGVTIFHNRYGKVLTLHNLRRTFREVVKDAGLEGLGITPRWYRRTGATILARGMGVDAAATFLGHTSTAITEKHYIQPDSFIDQTPAAILDRALRPVDPDEGVPAAQLTIHSDNGTSMASKTVALLLAELDVVKSHSRPHVSNDNPYSEALFKTIKYCPTFPGKFATLASARTFYSTFFETYNHHHRHSGLGLLTPAVVHAGQAETVRAASSLVLDAAHARHANRFSRPPQPPHLPEIAWINRPDDTETDTHK